jgi:hypothetical protein
MERLEDRRVLSTLTVLNHLDSGAGSLRAEIAAAHNGDTIVFAPSLNGQTITLTSGELLIRKNLTITGPGAGELTISGGGLSRVFEVAPKENVTLSGLTISNGAAPGVGQAGEGAGILNYGTLTVSGSTLSANTAAQDGGGIFNYGTLTVSGSTLSANTAFPGVTLEGGYGGGIFNYEGTVTVSNSSTLSGNSAGYGGGIVNWGGALTVSGSTLSGNSAYDGGGIWNDGTAKVSSSTLSGNSAYNAGGGIYNIRTLTVENSSSISGNSAPVGSGADVFNEGVLYLDRSSTIGILDGNPAVPI